MHSLVLQVTKATDFNKLADEEPWLNSTRLVVKPDMLFGKRGKSGLVGSFKVHLDFEAYVVNSKLSHRFQLELL